MVQIWFELRLIVLTFMSVFNIRTGQPENHQDWPNLFSGQGLESEAAISKSCGQHDWGFLHQSDSSSTLYTKLVRSLRKLIQVDELTMNLLCTNLSTVSMDGTRFLIRFPSIVTQTCPSITYSRWYTHMTRSKESRLVSQPLSPFQIPCRQVFVHIQRALHCAGTLIKSKYH